MKTSALTVIIFLIFHNGLYTQTIEKDYPRPGSPCPDFTLTDVRYFDKKQVSLKDFSGQWLILDFWSRYCSSCIESFPKMNKLSHTFPGKVQLIMVGYDDDAWKRFPEKIRSFYEKIRQKQHLDFPVAFDSVTFHRFGVHGVPHVLVIDDKGVVRAKTYKIDSVIVSDFLAGRNPVLPKAFNEKEQEELWNGFDQTKPLFTNGNGGNDTGFLFRSLLSNYDPAALPTAAVFAMPAKWPYGNMYQQTGIPLLWLFSSAYGETGDFMPGYPHSFYGKYALFQPALEIKDSSVFQPDFTTGRGLYNYSLIVPPSKANMESMRRIMQRDLKNYFDYDVNLETRMSTCWNLVSAPGAKEKLKTKGGKEGISGDSYTSLSFTNVRVGRLIEVLWSFFQLGPPFIDQTGIDGNIDLMLESDNLHNFEEIKKALQKNGLDLVKSEKEMKVLVIRDAKNN